MKKVKKKFVLSYIETSQLTLANKQTNKKSKLKSGLLWFVRPFSDVDEQILQGRHSFDRGWTQRPVDPFIGTHYREQGYQDATNSKAVARRWKVISTRLVVYSQKKSAFATTIPQQRLEIVYYLLLLLLLYYFVNFFAFILIFFFFRSFFFF